MEHHVSSVIRGHHVSKSFWMPATEDSNTHDRFAVALSAPGVGVIGHVPRVFSRVVRHFLLHGGTLTCKVSWRRQLGKGLKVPCLYTFHGKKYCVFFVYVLKLLLLSNHKYKCKANTNIKNKISI